MNKTQYLADLQVELDTILDVIEETWGFRPQLTVQAEPILRINLGFNIVGFAHQGQSVFITPASAEGYRKPRLIARRFAQELVSHRNTCGECGTGTQTLYDRLWALRYFLSGREWARKLKPESLVEPDAVEYLLHPRIAQEVSQSIRFAKDMGVRP